VLAPDTYSDRVARFGCGALVGGVVVIGTLLGGAFYDLLERPLNNSLWFVIGFAIALPIGLGALSVAGGWRVPEKLSKWLFNL
jgi:hypothetical protein